MSLIKTPVHATPIQVFPSPLVCAEDCKDFGILLGSAVRLTSGIQIAKAGISIEPEDSREIANTIIEISKMEKDKLNKWGENAKKYVEENHTYTYLTQLLISTMQND